MNLLTLPTGPDGCSYARASNGRWYVMHNDPDALDCGVWRDLERKIITRLGRRDLDNVIPLARKAPVIRLSDVRTVADRHSLAITSPVPAAVAAAATALHQVRRSRLQVAIASTRPDTVDHHPV